MTDAAARLRAANPRYQPISGAILPRFAGPSSFMRLPIVPPDDPRRAAEVEVGLVGVPWDGGTTNRPGARHGPRRVRDLSTMIRLRHPVSRRSPFEDANVADMGDVGPNPADVADTLARVTDFFTALRSDDVTPVAVGGDHLTSLPILRALAADAPLGMIHFDAHTDLFDSYFDGFRYTHGTPFRRAIEEGLLDPKRVVQIGIRGTMYDGEDIAFGRSQGVRIIEIEEFFDLGVEAVTAEARRVVGDAPTYVSFDIDFVDPAFAPGTGTPEIGGPTSFQAQQLLRGLSGVDIVGADLVEVSPPFDAGDATSWLAASLLFELLCPVSEAVARRRA